MVETEMRNDVGPFAKAFSCGLTNMMLFNEKPLRNYNPIMAVFKNGHKFFDTLPIERWGP